MLRNIYKWYLSATVPPTGNPNFDKAVVITLSFEGGLNIDRKTGEVSKYGISLRSYPQLGRNGIINLTKARAVGIYYNDFWKRLQLDDYYPDVAIKLFDISVNMGPGRAIELLNRALTVCKRVNMPYTFDTLTDQSAISISKSIDPEKLLSELRRLSVDYYTRLAAEKPDLRKYLSGWLKRAKT